MVYEFTARLSATEAGADTTTLADRLYAQGCDDGTCFSRDGQVFLAFDREADSLEQAIRSAIADVNRSGVTVLEVLIESAELAKLTSATP